LDSKTINTFSAYGLVWQTDFPCQGGQSLSNNVTADVKVSMGSTPLSLGGNAFIGNKFEATPGKLLLKTLSIADYFVSDGRRIIISPKISSTPETVQKLLFGWATAGILQQRRTLALHASSVAFDSSAIAFCGDSGVGKSTLVGLLANRGLTVLDDNILALLINEREIRAHPGIGYIRLLQDALKKMGQDVSGLQRIDNSESASGKYILPLKHDYQCNKPTKLKRVYILKHGLSLCMRSLLAREKIDALRENIFMLRFAKGLARTADMFEQLLMLGAQVEVIELTVPHEKGAEFLADEIFRQLSLDL
jgi:hypothetical protein